MYHRSTTSTTAFLIVSNQHEYTTAAPHPNSTTSQEGQHPLPSTRSVPDDFRPPKTPQLGASTSDAPDKNDHSGAKNRSEANTSHPHGREDGVCAIWWRITPCGSGDVGDGESGIRRSSRVRYMQQANGASLLAETPITNYNREKMF